MQLQSEEIDLLMADLGRSHKEFGVIIEKNAQGNRAKYANLPRILNFISQFSKFGLYLTQKDYVYNEKAAIYTQLFHTPSKQWTASVTVLTPSPAAQSIDQGEGGSSTYKKRYAAMGICGLFCSNDPSDINEGIPLIDDRQYEQIMELLQNDQNKTSRLLEKAKVATIDDIEARHFSAVIKFLKGE